MQLYTNTSLHSHLTFGAPLVSWDTGGVFVLNISGWALLFNKLVQISFSKDYITFKNAGSLILGWANTPVDMSATSPWNLSTSKSVEQDWLLGSYGFFLSFKCLNSSSLCYAKHLLGSIWCDWYDYAVKDHTCTTAGIEPFKGYIYLKNIWNTYTVYTSAQLIRILASKGLLGCYRDD